MGLQIHLQRDPDLSSEVSWLHDAEPRAPQILVRRYARASIKQAPLLNTTDEVLGLDLYPFFDDVMADRAARQLFQRRMLKTVSTI